MIDAYAALREEFGQLEIARSHFPMWTDWGVADESVTVHSLGLTYLTTVGQFAGYACCCECPLAGLEVRADSVWWNKTSRTPAAIFEFERHKGGNELVNKVQNLLRAYHRLEAEPVLLCLVFWTKNFYPLGDEGVIDLWQIFERGFATRNRHRVPPASRQLLRIFECLHEDVEPGLHRLKQIAERRRS